MTTRQVPAARRWVIGILASVAAAIVIAAIVYDVSRRAAGMRVAPTRTAAVMEAPAGTAVKAVVRLASATERDVYPAELLESIDETHYRETPRHIDVTLTEATRIVMGSRADITAGAIVHVSGTIERPGRLRAGQVVILSGYVRVTSG